MWTESIVVRPEWLRSSCFVCVKELIWRGRGKLVNHEAQHQCQLTRTNFARLFAKYDYVFWIFQLARALCTTVIASLVFIDTYQRFSCSTSMHSSPTSCQWPRDLFLWKNEWYLSIFLSPWFQFQGIKRTPMFAKSYLEWIIAKLFKFVVLFCFSQW